MATSHETVREMTDGVEFELTLNTKPDPMAMARADGYSLKYREFKGVQVAPQTRRFKLVRVGHCYNLDVVRNNLRIRGNIPEGQWREAFKQAFPCNDGNGPIGFADPSWASLSGDTHFPVLLECGTAWASAFRWAGCARGAEWRWLVACE